MALRNLRYENDDLLRKISKPVKNISEKIKTLLEDMTETMIHSDGVGLAAPQVGVLRRAIVVRLDPESEIYALINPEIVEHSGSQITPEGCLSIPGESGYVERPQSVTVKAQDLEGNEVIIEASERLAVIFCHEIDHLDGILYVDKLTDPPEGEEEYYDEDYEEDGDYEDEDLEPINE